MTAPEKCPCLQQAGYLCRDCQQSEALESEAPAPVPPALTDDYFGDLRDLLNAQHLAAVEGVRKEVERELAGATDETVNRRVAKLLYDLDHGLDAPWWDEATDEERERYLARARKVEPIVNAYWRSRFDTSQQEIERLTAERDALRVALGSAHDDQAALRETVARLKGALTSGVRVGACDHGVPLTRDCEKCQRGFARVSGIPYREKPVEPPVTDHFTKAVRRMAFGMYGNDTDQPDLDRVARGLTAALPHLRQMMAEELRAEADAKATGVHPGFQHLAAHTKEGWYDAADHLTRPEVMK